MAIQVPASARVANSASSRHPYFTLSVFDALNGAGGPLPDVVRAVPFEVNLCWHRDCLINNPPASLGAEEELAIVRSCLA